MKVKYLFAIAAIIALIASCSQKEASKSSDGAQYAAGSDQEQVKRDITDFFNRMREGDKTVLYENEFPYYKANYSLNDIFVLALAIKPHDEGDDGRQRENYGRYGHCLYHRCL